MTKEIAEFEAPADRSPDFPLTEFQILLESVVERIGPPNIKHPARHAFVHLRKAWKLHPIDSEMSYFRAITAEEEAATALIRALKLRKYPGASSLSDRRHPEKAAIWAVLSAVGHSLAEKNVRMPNLYLRKTGKPHLETVFDIQATAGLEFPLEGKLDHPFNFVMRSDRKGPFEVHRFDEEMLHIANTKGADSIADHVSREANMRNRVIYASNEGMPSVRFGDGLLLERAHRVMILLVVTIGVLQTKMHQPFVVQCLGGLLAALKDVDIGDFDYPELETDSPRLEIKEQQDGSMKASLVQRQRFISFRYQHSASTISESGGSFPFYRL